MQLTGFLAASLYRQLGLDAEVIYTLTYATVCRLTASCPTLVQEEKWGSTWVSELGGDSLRMDRTQNKKVTVDWSQGGGGGGGGEQSSRKKISGNMYNVHPKDLQYFYFK